MKLFLKFALIIMVGMTSALMSCSDDSDYLENSAGSTLEHSGEYHRHNHHDQQRIQNAPDISQPAAPVFQFDIFGDQQLQQITVSPEFVQILHELVLHSIHSISFPPER